jgi:hypothetical protein
VRTRIRQYNYNEVCVGPRYFGDRSREELVAKLGVDEIELNYVGIQRNSIFREFLGEILGEAPWPGCTISRQALEARSKILREPQEMTNG